MPSLSPKTLVSASALALLLACGSGCNIAGLVSRPITVTKPFTTKAPATGPLTLTIDAPLGDLTLRAGASDTIEIQGTLGGEDQAALDGVKVVLEGEGASRRLTASGPKGKSWKADLVVTLPAKTSPTVKAGVGNVAIEGLAGAFQAEVGVGNLRTSGLAIEGNSGFEVGVGNASVEVASWSKDSALKVESGVGNATASLPLGMGVDVQAETGVGGVTLKGAGLESIKVTKEVTGATAKGATASETQGRRLSLEAGTGDIQIEGRPGGEKGK